MLLIRGKDVIAAGLFNDVDGVDAGDHLVTDSLLFLLLLPLLLLLLLQRMSLIVCLVLLGGRAGRLGWTAHGFLVVALGGGHGLEQLLGGPHELIVVMMVGRLL